MIDVNHLCPGCMKPWEDPAQPCGNCGFSFERAVVGRELPPFSIIAGRYLLGTKIGAGGFGIIYIAMDLVEEKVVAIKEFFPASLASREGSLVRALPGEDGRSFRKALRGFRREAELMARFREVEGIVACRDFVEENDTAYLVMDYVEGPNLKQYMRQTGKTFTQAEALALMRPILLAADAMHRQNVLHRDISPENLILKPDHTLTLIDFGAAREYDLEEDENLTVILKHGYAPEEQYHFGSRQGPWTDLYACCAVLYQMVSGILPQDAAGRTQRDMVLPLDEIDGVVVTRGFARVIEKGMTVHATERYPSIRALLKDLYPDDAAARNKDEVSQTPGSNDDEDSGDVGDAPSDEATIAMPGVSGQPDHEKGLMEIVSQAAAEAEAEVKAENMSGIAGAASGKSGRTAKKAAVIVAAALALGCISVFVLPFLTPRFGLPWLPSVVGGCLVSVVAAAVLAYVFFHSPKWTAIAGAGALIVDAVLFLVLVFILRDLFESGSGDAKVTDSDTWAAAYGDVQADGTVWREIASQSYTYGDTGKETWEWYQTYDCTVEYEYTENGVTRTANFNYNGGDSGTVIEVYDTDGILLRSENSDVEGIYEVQRDGNTVTFSSTDNAGNVYLKGSAEYLDGRLIHETVEGYNDFGQVFASAEYTREYEGGKIIWQENRETEGDTTRTEQTQYDPVIGKASYRYEEEHDGDGSYLKTETTYEYDEYGNVVMRREVQDSYNASTGEESAGIVTEYTYVYEYDSQARIIEEDFYLMGMLMTTTTYGYDHYGNLARTVEYSEDSAYDQPCVTLYVCDQLRNLLTKTTYNEDGTCYFDNSVYEEYALEDGIFVPTGRTSGSQEATLPSPTYDGGGSSPESRESEGLSEGEGAGEDEATIRSMQMDVIEHLENEGMYVVAEAEIGDPESMLTAVERGSMDGALLYDVDVRLLDEGYSIVLPPAEWFAQDGSFDAIVTYDMDLCWEISEALLGAGYYRQETTVGGFFDHLARKNAGDFIFRTTSSSQVPPELYLSYLEYWGMLTGNEWQLVVDEDNVYSKNDGSGYSKYVDIALYADEEV